MREYIFYWQDIIDLLIFLFPMDYGFDSAKAKDFPQIVQLAITNVCDMACGHCPHPVFKRSGTYRASYMNMDLYRKIADEVAVHPESSLRLFGWGEPLLHPDLVEMVGYAKDRGVGITNLITNGLQLNPEVSRGLIRSGLDVLEVSLDALSRESYHAVRGNPEHFDQVVRNIETYVRLRDELHGRTYVTVSMIRQPAVIDEAEAFAAHWASRVDDVVFRVFHDFMGYAKDKAEITLPIRHPCRTLWSRFNVNSAGLVSVCFNDWNNVSIIGDLNDPHQSIEQIWAGEEYDSFRESHLRGEPKGICRDCNDWIGASWEMPYEVLFDKARRKIHARTLADQKTAAAKPHPTPMSTQGG
jgi:pyruvate-formate lyase-activating enzyme